MDETAKETVIIVHGTWAAPEPGGSRWYEPVNSIPPAIAGFTAKLDAALQELGSPARCWAHCTQGNPIFQWSGKNSWIERTHAASALGDYVTKLRKEGWRCHIVAHSHGGNVVVEALPQIIAAPDSNESPGTIVTLGTPFIDTMSPILKRAKQVGRILDIVSWIGFGIIMLALAIVLYSSVLTNEEGLRGYFLNWINAPALLIFLLSIILVARQCFGRTHSTAQVWPEFLAIGSSMDEAWQILHHIRSIPNPLAITSNPLSYLSSSLRSNISRSGQIARIHGTKSYRDLGIAAKLVLVITHVFALILIVIIAGASIVLFFVPPPGSRWEFALGVGMFAVFFLIVVLFLTRLLEETFYSAFLSPFRWCMRRVASLGSIFTEIAEYVVLNRGWSVLQAIAMGLEGYRFQLPLIERCPTCLPKNCVKDEDMPKGAEQRALATRNAWIGRHVADVSQTFSKILVTAADMDALLRTVEADQSLVHAAYYMDDDCIARIADWIACGG
jgi:hypothetical protein